MTHHTIIVRRATQVYEQGKASALRRIWVAECRRCVLPEASPRVVAQSPSWPEVVDVALVHVAQVHP